MYNIQISEKELDTILVALNDSKEMLSRQESKLSISYFELPNDLKFFWRDEETYKKYKDETMHKCFIEETGIDNIKEKLKRYKEMEE